MPDRFGCKERYIDGLLVGEELKTGESMPGRITIQMSQGAEQGHQYGFEVKITYGHEEA